MCSTKSIGSRGEQFAEAHLQRCGYLIIARNYRTRLGEIDLIATDRENLIFCEVKTRRSAGASPWEGFTELKRRQVRRMAAIWLSENGGSGWRKPRFDAIGVIVDCAGKLISLDHLTGAF